MRRWYGKNLKFWLYQRYLLAVALLLLLISVSFVLLQSYLARELRRADVVQLSTRQRVITDALVTLSSQLTSDSADASQASRVRDEFQAQLKSLLEEHKKFREESLTLSLTSPKVEEASRLLAAVQNQLASFHQSIRCPLGYDSQACSVSLEDMPTVTRNFQFAYMREIRTLVLLHTEEGVMAIGALKTRSYFFALAALILLLLEHLFIFRPTSKIIEKQFYEIDAALQHVQATEKVLEQNQEALQFHAQALEDLNSVFANPQRSFSDQITDILTITQSYLGLELGLVSRIKDDTYRVEYTSSTGPVQVEKGATFELGNTFCSVTWKAEAIRYFTDPLGTEWECHPCYQQFGLNAYIAAPFQVRGIKYGTVNFSSTKRRDNPFSALEISIIKHVTGLIAALFERSLVEQEIVESKERLRVVLDSAPVLVAYVDHEMIYRYSNATHQSWFGRDSCPIEGQSMVEVLGAECFQSIKVYVEAALRGEKKSFETRMNWQDSSFRWLEDFYIPEFDKEGENVIGFFVFAFDIEERKRAELELKRSNEELEQFAYVASHDLKAPLRAIKNYANWVIEDSGSSLPPESLEHLVRLSSRAAKMQDLLNDLLEYSRAGKIQGESSETRISSLIHEVIELIAPPSDLNFEVPRDDVPVRVVKAPLELVLRNLIGNAVKYGYRPAGTIRFSIALRPRLLQIEVQDDGPGIPKEYHEKVFQLFQSMHQSEEKSGTGMGLALVKKVVETSGGTISLESEEGRGCRFCFSYPYEPTDLGLSSPSNQA